MLSFIRRHPIGSYFTLAFGLSWLGVLAVAWPGQFPAAPGDADARFTYVYLAMLVGPPVAGIAMTAITRGRRGLGDYRDRLLKWRVGPEWYATALLLAPIALLGTLVILTSFTSEFVPALIGGPGPAPLGATSGRDIVVTALLVGAGAGFFEELGWTGYATPALRARGGMLTTGWLLGLAWGAWHFLPVWWGSAAAFGSVPPALYLAVALFAFLPAYRVLMVWMYERTQSLFVGILMHASLTASMLMLQSSTTGWHTLVFDLAFGGVLWVTAFLVAGVRRSSRAQMRTA